MGVSILILLDVISEVIFLSDKEVTSYRFNPYSVGCYFRRYSLRENAYRIPCFNPYSVGCYFRRVFVFISKRNNRFVSILILLDVISEGFVVTHVCKWIFGFNPYSVGCYFRRLLYPTRNFEFY